MTVKKNILLILPAIFIICLFFFLLSVKVISHNKLALLKTEKKKNAWRQLSKEIKNELVGFNGQVGMVIKDLNNGWKITSNQDNLFPSASLVKIPIMVSYFYAAEKAKINLSDTIKLSRKNKVAGSGILKYIPAGKEFNIGELIELMITRSDNVATNMLIEFLGFDFLNNSFKELGLKHTNIVRKMMDFRRRSKGIENYTTANEICQILEKIYFNRFMDVETSQKCLSLLKKQKISDRIPARLPDNIVVAHKTGLEKGICHDVGIVFTEKGNFLICVLTKHKNRVAKPAKKLIANIAWLTYNYYINECE